MRSVIKKACVLLIVAAVFVAVHTAGAETVEGMIKDISYRPNKVTVEHDGTNEIIIVSGVRLNYLCNQYTICLEIGEMVLFETYEYECKDGSINLMATSITVGDATVKLR